jgi:hypothetical protein
MKTSLLSLFVLAIACTVGSPAIAQVAAEQTDSVYVRVVDVSGKPVRDVTLFACKVLQRTKTCSAQLVGWAISRPDGLAIFEIPFHIRPNEYAFEIADSNRIGLSILDIHHERLVDGAWVYNKEFCCITHDGSRSMSSAFQPTSTADLYNVSASQIETILGKKP